MKRYYVNLFFFLGIVAVDGFAVHKSHFSVAPSGIVTSSLFQHESRNRGKQRQLQSMSNYDIDRRSDVVRALRLRFSQLFGRLRRSFMKLAVSMLVFAATAAKTLPAHASTAVATGPLSKSMLSPSLEQIVHRYVRDHMFADDVYDPVESIYREGINDNVKGVHPRELSEITSSVLGQDGVKVEKVSSSSGIGDWLMAAVTFLQRKGISESTAIILLTGSFVVAGPVTFLLGATMVGSQSKRQIKSVMKKRYGDTYT